MKKGNKIVKESKSKINLLKNKKLMQVILVAIVVIIALIIIINLIVSNIVASKYKKYEEKMSVYGFDKLYDNQKAKSRQHLSKAEGIRLAIATVFNTDDITGFANEYTDYPGQTWVEYAKYFKIITYSEITEDNYNDDVTYEELVSYFEKAKSKFTEIEQKTTDKEVLNNSSAYSQEVQTYFSDMVGSEIIEVKTEKIDAKKAAIKGQANELVINFLEKFSLITLDSSRLKISDFPKNVDDYPYTLFDVPNEVYEYEFTEGAPLKDEMTAKELYKYQKDMYMQVKEYIEGYYKTVLNVNYETIDYNKYCTVLDNYTIFKNDSETIENYVEYVKNNHIKIEATVSFVEPCLYFDGAYYEARIKINLKVISSDTRENLLLYDSAYIYPDNEYEFYADVPMTNAIGSRIIYIQPVSVTSKKLEIGNVNILLNENVIQEVENINENTEENINSEFIQDNLEEE